VLGLSASSQAGLLAEIDRLGTNLLTVTNGQSFFGETAELPVAAPGMVSRIGPVTQVQYTGEVSASVYRSPLIPSFNTNGLSVLAVSLGLTPTVGTSVARGRYLNAATATEPVAVLGSAAAKRLGIDRVFPGERILVGNQWFYVAGILRPAVLAPEIDSSVLVGFPAAETYLGFDGHPSTVYVRARTEEVAAVQSVLGATANPEAPNEVNVSQPSSALVARAQAKSAFTGLFLGLGAVALLVGGVGVANIMVISVLERRSEIGLRRALGATKGNIRGQFLAEAAMLAILGGVAGVAIGAVATAVYASTKGWAVVVPPLAWAGGFGAALAIGAVAGLLPALRAARLSPTEALRTV
jgi:putative ABC transport system permease protein